MQLSDSGARHELLLGLNMIQQTTNLAWLDWLARGVTKPVTYSCIFVVRTGYQTDRLTLLPAFQRFILLYSQQEHSN